MEAPGEKLLIKLWETLTEKGIGSLLKPWQIRREGKALAETQAESMLLLAQAEKAAEDIKQGKLIHDYTVRQLGSNGTNKLEPKVDAENLVKLAAHINYQDTIRTEVNTAKAILVAESILKDETEEPSRENIDPDWLYRWRDYAGGVSTEELQSVWGKLLAGEIKAPGTFSLRTLEFIRGLSQQEATLIEKLLKFTINDYIFKGTKDHSTSQLLNDYGFSFSDLLELQGLGIIAGVEAVGGLKLDVSITNPNELTKLFQSNDRCLLVHFENIYQKCTLEVYPLTTLGKQLYTLCKAPSEVNYLISIGKLIKQQGFKVHLALVEKHLGDKVIYSNGKEI